MQPICEVTNTKLEQPNNTKQATSNDHEWEKQVHSKAELSHWMVTQANVTIAISSEYLLENGKAQIKDLEVVLTEKSLFRAR